MVNKVAEYHLEGKNCTVVPLVIKKDIHKRKFLITPIVPETKFSICSK